MTPLRGQIPTGDDPFRDEGRESLTESGERRRREGRERPKDERTNASVRATVEGDGHGGKKIAVRVPGWIVALVLTGAGIGTGGVALGARFGVNEPKADAPHTDDARIAVLETQQRADGKRLDAFEAWMERVERKLDKALQKKE